VSRRPSRPGGRLFDPEGPGGQIADPARPEPGETVITKACPTPRRYRPHTALKATGRTSLILAGFMTHMCVSSTARAALDLGYRTTVIADATATRALPDPTGGPDLDPRFLQRASLAELADRFAVVAPLAALVD
jgi:nicotinamidase-related amidase